LLSNARKADAAVATPPPTDANSAALLARRAIELGRATGDPRAFGRAEAVLAPWWTAPDPPAAIRLMRASLRQQKHDFAGAKMDLDALIAGGESSAQARLNRAALLMAQGEPKLALADCQALAARVSALVSAACTAAAEGTSGQLDAAIQQLSQALQAPGVTTDAPEWLWAQTLLAELLEAQGTTRAANAAYGRALAVAPSDPYLLAVAADFYLSQNQGQKVLDLLTPHAEQDSLLLRIVIAEQQLRISSSASTQRRTDLQARFSLASSRGEDYHNRELARRALDVLGDPPAALALAQKNWQSQKEPADAILLLRAARAAQQPEAAKEVLLWMQSTGVEHQALRTLAQALRTRTSSVATAP
jgi:tetratricopeptide (TPR) repeat protein